uniref:Uncharacterized protein n=1 Tax=Lactuca sativa TaxID=4236 RepID=A0A9R1WD88_LACSA|nr:hypothetical protein LSAT_V11C200056830 [Lactuca sativa]
MFFYKEMVLYATRSESNKRVKLNCVNVTQLTVIEYVTMLFLLIKTICKFFQRSGMAKLSRQLMISMRYVKNGQSLLRASFIDDMYGLLTMYQNNVMVNNEMLGMVS